MEPSGARRPLVYMLGEAPGEQEDRRGEPFVGPSGQALRMRIPREFRDRVRFSNVVRTRPPSNREPTDTEIECCRPSVVADIEAAKPAAIFGFGNIPLGWVLRQTGIGKWRGRHVPVRIGRHLCWFFLMFHPSYFLRMRRFDPRGPHEYGCDEEFTFALDMKRAFALVEQLPSPVVHTEADALAGVECAVDGDLDRVLAFIERAGHSDVAGIDYETSGKRPYMDGARILTAALSTRDATLAFPVDHKQSPWSPRQRDRVVGALREFVCKAPARKVSFNLSFEAEWSGHFWGLDAVWSSWDDAMAQAYVLDDRVHMGKPDTLSLEFQGILHYGLNLKALSTVDRANLDDEPLDQVLRYNAVDAKYHRLLYMRQRKLLQHGGLGAVYDKHVQRTLTMVSTQLAGVPVNMDVNTTLDEKYGLQAERAAATIANMPAAAAFRKKYRKEYRPGAPADGKQMLAMLGSPSESADEEALSKIKDPVGKETVVYRKAAKVRSTYVLPLQSPSIVFSDGRMHPVISTCQTRTGRTSSEEPNIQNWPKRQGESTEVRLQVEAPPGHKIVSIDWAAIQARNVAMESKDKNLIDSFWQRIDTHTNWMEHIVRQYPRWVKEGAKKLATDKALAKQYRQIAKNLFVFPSFFGAAGKSVANYLEIPEWVGEALHEEFWDEFRGIRSWHESVNDHYMRHGYVTGLSGYRRRAPVKQTERINTPIQADEALIVCDAMERLAKRGPRHLRAVMMIHDDLTFIWPTKRVDELADVAIDFMVNVPFKWAHIVPIEVEMSIGDNWYEMKEVGKYESRKSGAGYRQL